MSQEYTPIDCSLHDRLEAFATTRQRVLITHKAESGDTTCFEDVITDWVARAGAEYLHTAGGLEVRLDRLIAVEPKGDVAM